MAILHFFPFSDVQTAAIRNFFFLLSLGNPISHYISSWEMENAAHCQTERPGFCNQTAQTFRLPSALNVPFSPSVWNRMSRSPLKAAFLRLSYEKLLRLVLPLRRIRGKGWAALDVFAEVEVIH